MKKTIVLIIVLLCLSDGTATATNWTMMGGATTAVMGGTVDDMTGVSTVAYEKILLLARGDGWLAVYDPTNPATRTLRVDGENSYVSAIADGLGNLTDLAQATEGSQPLLLAGEFGQLAGMDGTADAKFLKTAVFTDLVPPVYIAVIAKSATAVQASRILLDGIASNRRLTFLMRNVTDNPFGFFAYAKSEVSGAVGDTASHIHSALFDTSAVLYMDGAAQNEPVNLTSNLTGITIGERFASAGTHWNGSYGPVLLYDGTPAARARKRMDALLQDLATISPATLSVTAERAITMSLSGSNEVFFSKDSATVDYIASMTKLMTVYVARQWITDAMLSATTAVTELSSLWPDFVQVGDVATLEAFFYATLVASDNTAAHTIAGYAGQLILDSENDEVTDPYDRFVTEMNSVAASNGWTGATFVDDDGDGANAMSAAQLADLFYRISSDDFLMTASGTLSYNMVISGGPNPRTYAITHTIPVSGGTYTFPEFVAGKTGTTALAGHCCAMVWENAQSERFVSVVIDSDTDMRYKDLRYMINTDF